MSTLNYPRNIKIYGSLTGAALLVRARAPPETWTTRQLQVELPEGKTDSRSATPCHSFRTLKFTNRVLLNAFMLRKRTFGDGDGTSLPLLCAGIGLRVCAVTDCRIAVRTVTTADAALQYSRPLRLARSSFLTRKLHEFSFSSIRRYKKPDLDSFFRA